jgi:hypothetical protein
VPRRQIEALRAQLAPHAEALEEHLASDRERWRSHSRRNRLLDPAFSDVVDAALESLEGQPEARPHAQERVAVMHGQPYSGSNNAKSDSRTV